MSNTAQADPAHEPLEVVMARLGFPVDGYNEVTVGEPRDNLAEWATSLPATTILDEASGGAGDLWPVVAQLQGSVDLMRQALDLVQSKGFANKRTQDGGWLGVAGAQMALNAARLLVASSSFGRLGVITLGRAALEATAAGCHILTGTADEATSWEDDPRATSLAHARASPARSERARRLRRVRLGMRALAHALRRTLEPPVALRSLRVPRVRRMGGGGRRRRDVGREHGALAREPSLAAPVGGHVG